MIKRQLPATPARPPPIPLSPAASEARPLRQRRQAVQARAQVTVERVLDAAARLMEAPGPERVTMTDIAREAGIAIGSVYQYFGNLRAVHAALFARHAAWARALLEQHFGGAVTREDLLRAATTAFDTYFQAHQEDRLIQAIWAAMQTDAELQALDLADTLENAALLVPVVLRIAPTLDATRVLTACALMLNYTVATARFAAAAADALGTHAPSVSRAVLLAAWEAMLETAAGA